MSTQTIPLPRFSTAAKPAANLPPERVDRLPEQPTGPIPLRGERPIAEVLAERLNEAGQTSVSPTYVP
jgi:hypothetical protein